MSLHQLPTRLFKYSLAVPILPFTINCACFCFCCLSARYLVQFLSLLSEQQAVNKMTPSNIAIVLGPNLLWPRSEGCESCPSKRWANFWSSLSCEEFPHVFFSFVFREMMSFDMASASSVQVVMVIEPLIQYSSSLFPEGDADDDDDVIVLFYSLCTVYSSCSFLCG